MTAAEQVRRSFPVRVFGRLLEVRVMLRVRMSIALPVFLLAGFLSAIGSADDPRVEKLYGDGVHAFYRGDYARAVQSFDLATGSGSLDPRVYYFRGFAKLRQNRADEARFDFQYGAQLEASQGRTDVGRSLQRLQGHDRLLLEQYRRRAQQVAALSPRPEPSPAAAPTAAAAPPEPKVTGRPASEIPEPLRNLPTDSADPFADQASGLLGRGEIQPTAKPGVPAESRPTATPATTAGGPLEQGQAEITGQERSDPFAADDPFGGPTAPADAGAPADDPFADGGSVFGQAASPAAADGSGSATKRGPLGAVFRALTRSAAANPAVKQGQELLEGARSALPIGSPPEDMPGPSDQDPFFEGGAEDVGPAPADAAGQDPFMTEPQPPAPGDSDDPFADDATPMESAPTESTDDPFGAGPATDDPFSTDAPPAANDQDDPFAAG
jgi:hypothetical protein